MTYTRLSEFHLQNILSWLSVTRPHVSSLGASFSHSCTHAATIKVAVNYVQ